MTESRGTRVSVRRRWALVCLMATAMCIAPQLTSAQQQTGRFLAKEDIVLLGIGLQVAPADQTVPINIATIVSTYLQSPTQIPQGVPPFAPDAVVQATLRGPSYPNGLDLTTKPNTPFNIPPLGVPGLHTVDNIRLVSNGEVLLYGSPQSVTINVIAQLLVTQVTARPLTADEIRQNGIVFDKTSFQAYNFSAAFAIQNQTINISFPVVLPTTQSAAALSNSTADVPTIPGLTLPTLQTIIPDTLRLQTQVPNLSVIGFTLKVPALAGQNLIVPPIPGVIVIPGNIGFLNQFFSVMLMVGNVAPTGSNLVVTDLQAHLALPPGNDQVLGSGDDPLRMAHTASGESPSTQLVVQPGPDGQLGTADDIASLGPGQNAQAQFLVEGLREGTHTVDISMTGTLNGLPIGPVPITGDAVGAVLVRNPTFTLTFTHPDTVQAGEPYTLDVTVTNTSASPANFVSLNLLPQNLSGATLVSDSSQQVDSIPPEDSATVHFKLVSKVSGKVTAATLDSDENVAGRFQLKAAVGELGVPVSPDSLVLPSQASSLPDSLRDAVVGMLGKAWAVATAPPAALPAGIARFSQKIVLDRGVQAAEAGFRVSLHEPIGDSALQLAMDFSGSDAARLSTVYPNASDLSIAQADFPAFDALRRASVRGDVLAGAVAGLLAPAFASDGVAAFHQDIAQKIAYRPGSISVIVGGAGGPLPFSLSLLDAAGNQVGGTDSTGKVLKQIPYGDYLSFTDGAGTTTGQMALVSAPTPGAFTIRLDAVPGVPDAPFTLSVVVPDAAGHLRQVVFQGVTSTNAPTLSFAPADPYSVSVVMHGNGTTLSGSPLGPASDAATVEPLPTLLGVVQQWQADAVSCPEGAPALYPGRVVAALFNKEITPDSAQDGALPQDITNYTVDGNAVVGVALQPGHRIVYLALRDPIGPFVPRQLTISGVADPRGQAAASSSSPIETTVTNGGAVVSGRLLQADGTAISFGNARLFYVLSCDDGPIQVGISSKSADVNGQYSWDYVLLGSDIIAGVDPEGGAFRQVQFSPARNAQRLNVDIALLGRGTLQGRTLAQDGVTPLQGTSIRVTSLTDQSQYGATSDDQGRFTIAKIPVGNILIEAVNLATNAKVTLSDNLSLAGATLTRDLTLFKVDTTQITVQYGNLTGHVFGNDGATPSAGLPVVAYYQNNSQPGVQCPASDPSSPPPPECAVAIATTDSGGAFTFSSISAGGIRLDTFNQSTLEQGGARVVVPANGTVDAIVLLGGGLGTVQGTVFDAAHNPIAGARVGGGLSLTTTDVNGQFTLTDVPVGQRTIVAVSDQLGTSGQATIDLIRDGDTVNVTIVLTSVASVAGTVFLADGVTPVANTKVYIFQPNGSSISVVGTATTDGLGHYTVSRIPLGNYTVSAFKGDFSDGNIVAVGLQYNNQTLRADIKFRGGGGRVTGVVYDDDGQTPLKARVGISGDRLTIAGGLVGTGFQRVANFSIVDTDFTTGQFSVGGLWTGAFTLSAVGQFSPDPISLDGNIPSAGANVQMNLRLQATSRISGTVFQPDGVTAAGANLVVTYASKAFKTICDDDDNCTNIPQGIQEENVVTDTNGQYVLPVVNAGAFSITVTDPATGKTAQVQGSVRAGQQVDLPIRLLGLGQLTVNVFGSDAVTPIPGASVEVMQTDYPNKDVTLVADTQGAAAFTGGDAISEGAFVVKAVDLRNGLAGRASGKITSDGQSLTLNVYLYNASGTAFGTVFRPDGITPVPNADVVISKAGAPLAFSVTDAAGHYSQDLIPLGPFTVEVFEAATARRGNATGRVDLDKEQVPVNVTEAALGRVTGTAVASGALQPLVGALVDLVQQLPSGLAQRLVTTTGTDGTFSFPGVSLGPFTLSLAISQGGLSGSITAQSAIQSEGQTVDVPLVVDIRQPIFGRVQGTTFNPDGSAAGNTEVVINLTTVTAAADGTFGLDHVAIGRFSISATSQVTHNVGSAYGQLSFDGEIVDVPIVLAGLGEVDGSVFFGSGQAAAGAQVQLTSLTTPICGGFCTEFADNEGNFTFANVPAGRFSVTSTDPLSGLRGAVGGVLVAGQATSVRVVLQPGGSLRGRALFSSGTPAAGITGDLVVSGQHLFVQTAADGTFSFDTVALVPYALTLQDPLGSGIAKRSGTITGTVDLGDISLNDTAFAVASSLPVASAIGVQMTQPVQIVFNEAVDFSTVNAADVSLSSADGVVTSTLAVGSGGTTVTLTPLSPLKDATRYSVRITGVTDGVGKSLAADYVFSFTTVDITPPAVVDLSPAANTTSVALASTVRVQFSEPIDPTKFTGPPLALSSPSGAISSRVDFLLGNTVIVLTPLQPLSVGTQYHVQSLAATDLSGNVQTAPLNYTFVTTTLTPPQVVSVTANHASVIEGTAVAASANVGNQDVSFVDFYLNDVFSGSVHTAPFTFQFQANATLGRPGDQIKVGAIATDTSGLRGLTQVATLVSVVADQPPAVVVTAPADGTRFKNGDRVTVTVHASDDVGVVQMGFKPATGQPQDAAARTISPASLDRTETFGFNVPSNATPGSTIALQASGVDTKGQTTQAATVNLVVQDSVAPTVTITGATTGSKVTPGQQTTVAVSAQDLGGVASIVFTASGAATFTQTRVISPSQNSAITSFTFTVSPAAAPGQSVLLSATATDQAGNVGTAASVLLPIADSLPPTVHLRTATGSLNVVRGATVHVIADADDETAVARVDLSATGALTFADSKAVSPPLGSASVDFPIDVPADLQPGQVLNVQAVATDTSGNASVPATLSLTVESLADVVFPPSALLVAGESQDLTVQLSVPAPAGGLTLNIVAADPNRVSVVTPSVQFGAGESAKTFTLAGVSGGTTTVTASVLGVQRGSMTVSVRGGIVSGTVFDPQFNPVSGAQIAIGQVAAVTDGSGNYFVEGVSGPNVTVQVLDPVSKLLGFATGTMNLPDGFVQVNVVLIPAGSIQGTVSLADGQTSAGTGVKVQLFVPPNLTSSIATTFTDGSGGYVFPLVAVGSYTIDATDTTGNHGRSSATISSTGQQLTVPVTYLGRGTVSGSVLDAGSHPVPNAAVTLQVTDVFGLEPTVDVDAGTDGTFTFRNVLVGSFAISAHDPVSGQSGAASGQIGVNGQSVTANVQIAPSGSISGTVFRADGVTPVPGASVFAQANTGFTSSTVADDQGRYSVVFVPLGTVQLTARDAGTRGIGLASVSLASNGATVTSNITLLGQGSLAVTVTDGSGSPIAAASVEIDAASGGATDTLFSQTDATGTVVVQNVLAGTFTVKVASGVLKGSVAGTLATGEVKQITVPLQATASIAGTVFQADGQTPVGDARVSVQNGNFTVNTTLPVNADGTFRVDNLPLDSYNLSARDSLNRTRALAQGVILNTNGQVVNVPLTFDAIGSVTGRVLNPDSSSAPNMVVQVQSLNPIFGAYFNVTTNAAGLYEVDGVPAGTFRVTTGDTTRLLLGEGSGTIATDGQVVNVDILLQGNAVTLPYYYLYDANRFNFDVQRDGSNVTGADSVFNFGGAPLLDVVVAGQANRFSGPSIGTFENHKQAITIQQPNGPAGLSVTRKVYVPNDGYFARYLDELSNPTANPITVDVRVTSNFEAYSGTPAIIGSSSGDATLSVTSPTNPDRWVVVDDAADGDPRLQGTSPAVAVTFDGPGAARRAGSATFAAGIPYSYVSQMVHAWTSVTVPPGGTVAFMYFLTQETSRAAATAAAQRLVQAPPEALAGLSAAEVQAIQNFAVPADGIGVVTPLPSIAGVVTGHVYDIDGATPLANAVVTFRSNSPLFARTQSVMANANGLYTFTGIIAANGSTLPIPVSGFTLQAQNNTSGVLSQTVAATFGTGQTTATQDVVFGNTSTISGTVRRVSGAIVTSGTIQINGSALPFGSIIFNISSGGTYTFNGLLPGAYTLLATVNNAQGSALTGTALVTIAAAGQVISANVVMPATGTVQGVVSRANGAPSISSWVALHTASYGFQRTAYADTSGSFTFADVPVGSYLLDYSDPRTGLSATTAAFTVAQDQTTVENLAVAAVGSVQVQVNYARGVAAVNSLVTITPSVSSGYYFYTDATGHVTIPNESAGSFTVTAYYPNNTNLYTQGTGTIVNEGDSPAVGVTLPAAGTVSGRLTYGNGNPDSYGTAQFIDLSLGYATQSASADANGNYEFDGVPLGGAAFAIRVIRFDHYSNSTGYPHTDVAGTPLAADGQVETVNVVLPAFASVQVTALRFDGTPLQNGRIEWQDTSYPYFQFAGYTNASGQFTVTGVREGAFTINVRDPNSYALLKQGTGTVHSTDEGLTLNLTVQMRSPSGSITGTIVAGNGTTPVANAYVQVNNAADGYNLSATYSGADGTYQLANIQSGDGGFTVNAYTPSFSSFVSQVGSFATQGQVLTFNFTLPVIQGTIQGRVFAGDGTTPLPGSYVRLEDSSGDYIDANYADQNGAYIFQNEWVPTQGFVITVDSPNEDARVSQPGTITVPGQTVQVNLTIPIFTGSVSGTVYAGDGVTPASDIYVRLSSAGGGEEGGVNRSAYTADDGTYQFTNLSSGPDGLVVAAYSNWPPYDDPQQFVTFASQGQNVVVNFTLQASVVQGRLTYSDGSAPDFESANVFVTASDGGTYYGTIIDLQDDFVVLGAPVGNITVTGQDGDSGLTVAATATIASTSTATVVNLALPPSGTITGHVLDASGNPVPNATVVLVSQGLAFQPSTVTDGSGAFSFAHIPIGTSTLQAKFTDTQTRFESAAAVLTTDDQQITVNISAAGSGQVTGHVLASGGAPVPNANLSVESLTGGGPLGHYTASATTDASGAYSVTGAPLGPIHVSAVDPANSQNVAVADGTLSGSTVAIDATLGTGTRFAVNLDGADGFRYDVQNYGALGDGGTVDRHLSNAYDGAYLLTVNGGSFSNVSFGKLEQNARQVVLGPQASGSLYVTRKVFVPAAGGFVRYLEILTNPLSAPLQATLTIQSNLGSDNATRVDVAPSVTDNTYAVTDQGGICCEPALGFVFSGLGPPVAPVSVVFANGSDRPSYSWQLTVPANGSVAIMHFGLQRDYVDPTVAAGAAQDLRDLVNLDALTGLTASERAAIRNFVVPQ